jgi:hypothetical protein
MNWTGVEYMGVQDEMLSMTSQQLLLLNHEQLFFRGLERCPG